MPINYDLEYPKLQQRNAELKRQLAEAWKEAERYRWLPDLKLGTESYSTGWNDCIRLIYQNRAAIASTGEHHE